MSNIREYRCDICENDEFEPIPNIGKYTNGQIIYVCKNCGLVYNKLRRTPQDMAKYWEEQMYGKESEKKDSYDPERPVFACRYAYATSFLKKHTLNGLDGKKVFDVGAGEGQLLEQLKKLGCIVGGVESSIDNSKVLNEKRLGHFVGTIEEYNNLPENKKFEKSDIATILFVLQNSQSATDMINAVYNQLEMGGVLFIMMGSRIMVPFKKPIGTYFHTLPQDVQPYHFSISTLQHLLAKCGFVIEKTNNYWDDELMCVLAKKVSKETIVEKMVDDYMTVLDWFKRWEEESKNMNTYIKKVPHIKIESPSYHTFYNEWIG